jgi:hypothetical protein
MAVKKAFTMSRQNSELRFCCRMNDSLVLLVLMKIHIGYFRYHLKYIVDHFHISSINA